MHVLFLAELVFGHCLRRDACRGGPGPSPIGHAELELMVAVCELLESTSRTATHFANPLFHPALQGLREPLQDYVEHHPERAAALLRQPRRTSIPRVAWRQEYTTIETLRPGFGLAEGIPLLRRTALAPTFIVADVQEFTEDEETELIRELLARGEGQPVTSRELGRLRRYLTLECRYLKGCDITWAHAPGPAVMDSDAEEEDDAGEGIMGNEDTDNPDQGPPRPCQTPDLPHWHLPLNGLFAESGAAARRRRSVRGGSDPPGPSVVARGRARVASAAGGFLHHVHTWCCSSPATQALSDCQQLYRGRHSVERRRRRAGT